MTRVFLFLIIGAALVFDFPIHAAPLTATIHTPSPDTTIWLAKPARNFLESLPLGNGRLGAMDFARR